jgi:hypothetical protein
MEINYKISFRLLPYILAELVAFFYVDYIYNATPSTVSNATVLYVVLATYFVPVSLIVIRIKSLLSKSAVVLGSFVYFAYALVLVLSWSQDADYFLESAIMFVQGFLVLLIVVACTEPPWDWRKLWDQIFQNHI